MSEARQDGSGREEAGPAEARMEFSIRPYDVDVAGIVSNIVYVRWLEDLRMEMLAALFPPGEMSRRGLVPVVVRTEIDYRSSLRFDDACTGAMRLESVGRTSIRLRARFSDGRGAAAAEALQVGVFLFAETHWPAPVPEEIRALADSQAASTG